MGAKSQYSRDAANNLFDYVLRTYKVKNDTALAKDLGKTGPNLSKIRTGRVTIGDAWILAIHESYGMSIKEIKGILNGQ